MDEEEAYEFMTKEQADKFLEEGEDILLNKYGNYISKYAAVIKKENDSDDHYAIEVGFHNIEELELLGGDSEQIRLDSINEIKELFKEKNDNLSDYVENDNIQFMPIKNIKYQCEDIYGESTKKYKKITGGVSIFDINFNSSSGTAGAFFKVKKDDSIYLLSNYHVLLGDGGEINDKVVHPSVADIGAQDYEEIGKIFWKEEIFNKEMDAAIAKVTCYPVDMGRYNRCGFPFCGIDTPKDEEPVKKCGKKTGLKHGKIKSINCTLHVDKCKDEFDLYRKQILTTSISDKGDSGSVVVNSDDKVIGLLFAGDESTTSIVTDINHIFNKVKETWKDFEFEKFI